MATLGGIGAGAMAGGLVGAIYGVSIPEYEAKRYEGRVRKGGILLSVHCDNFAWLKRAKTLLHQSGGLDIASTNEAKADFAVSERPAPRTRTGALQN